MSQGHLPWRLNNPSLKAALASAVAPPDLKLWTHNNLVQNPGREKLIWNNLSLTGKIYFGSLSSLINYEEKQEHANSDIV